MFELTQALTLAFITNLVAQNFLLFINTFQYTIQFQPVILIVLSVILLYFIYSLNRSQFAADYKYSTWQSGFRNFAFATMFFVIIVLGFGGFALVNESIMVGGRRRRT
jgi:hypothetical protein